MKRRFSAVLAALVLLMMLAVSASAETLAGGWEVTPYEGGAQLPEEAQAAFDKATAELVGAAYTPVALLSTQVVAGMNYCIFCQITPVVPDAVPYWALVYIYADLQGNAEITNVYDLDIPRHWAHAK